MFDDDKLLLPHLNPEGWDSFYTCIDPRSNCSILSNDDFNGKNRVELLVPYFREFQMDRHLEICEDIIQNLVDNEVEAWDYDEPDASYLLDLLQLAVDNDLEKSKPVIENALKTGFEGELQLDVIENIELKTVRSLVSLCLPLKRKTKEGSFVSSTCPALWQGMSSCIADRLNPLMLDKTKVNKSEYKMFSSLIYSLFQLETCEQMRQNDLDW